MKKILIVRADYYENISLGLENSALQVLKSNNYKKYDF